MLHLAGDQSTATSHVRPPAYIRSVPGGIVIDIAVIPRASRSAVAGTRDDALLVRVNAPPVEGAANRELIALVASVLGMPKRALSIVSGEHSRKKRLKVEGVTLDHALARISASL